MPEFTHPFEMIEALSAHVAQPVESGSAHFFGTSRSGGFYRFGCGVCTEVYSISEHNLEVSAATGTDLVRLEEFRQYLSTYSGMSQFASYLQVARGYRIPPRLDQIPPGAMMIIGEPEFVGAFPVRMDLEILPADDPASRTLGFPVRERVGVGVINPNGIRRLSMSRDEIPPPPKPPCTVCGAVDHLDHIDHLTRFEREAPL